MNLSTQNIFLVKQYLIANQKNHYTQRKREIQATPFDDLPLYRHPIVPFLPAQKFRDDRD
jgi:hypothetical protein